MSGHGARATHSAPHEVLTGGQPELRLLASSNVDQIAGLVFELATQVHVERQRRLALEELLARRGLIDRDDLHELVGDEGFRDLMRSELVRAQQALLDVLLESDDARTPLRPPTEER
jgi:hypothetical protein